MLIYLQKKKLANTDTDLVREYVYDKGLVGPSNQELLEELYEELRLSEDDVGQRLKIKVLFISNITSRSAILTAV
jgi:hypothetical protein